MKQRIASLATIVTLMASVPVHGQMENTFPPCEQVVDHIPPILDIEDRKLAEKDITKVATYKTHFPKSVGTDYINCVRNYFESRGFDVEINLENDTKYIVNIHRRIILL